LAPTSRATRSSAGPGGDGTISVIGFAGQFGVEVCAAAGADAAIANTKVPSQRKHRFVMLVIIASRFNR
jgi:hypothetical protein